MDETITQLCNDLNLDKQTADDVTTEFTKVCDQFIIEGAKTHWLACAIYAITNKNVAKLSSNNDKTEQTTHTTKTNTSSRSNNISQKSTTTPQQSYPSTNQWGLSDSTVTSLQLEPCRLPLAHGQMAQDDRIVH